jgi:hypothetical protein
MTPFKHIEHTIPYFLILLGGIFYVCTIRSGHGIGDDFAHYILLANNIVQDKPYYDVGLIPNPQYIHYCPTAYPVGYPLLLAPVVAQFGIYQLYPLKLVGIAFAVLTALFLHWLTKPYLTTLYSSILLVIWFAVPHNWTFKDNILSDYPFTAFTTLTLLLVQRWFHLPRPSPAKLLLIGTTLGYAYLIRTIGAMLLPLLIAYEVATYRTIRKTLWVSIGFIAIYIASKVCFEGADATSSYTAMLQAASIKSILHQLQSTALMLPTLLWATSGNAVTRLLFWILLGTSLIYLLTHSRNIIGWFALLYTLSIIIQTSTLDPRYFLPVFPLLVFAMLYLLRQLPPKIGTPAVLLIVGAMFYIGYIPFYRTINPTHIEGSIDEPYFTPMFQFIRDSIPAAAVIMSAKPRAILWQTGRKGIVSPWARTPQDFQMLCNQYQVTHLVTHFASDESFNNFPLALPSQWIPIYNRYDIQIYSRNTIGQVQ